MVSFDTSLHGRLKKAEEEKSVILVSKCKVKPGYSSELEIHVTGTSKVELSPRKYSWFRASLTLCT